MYFPFTSEISMKREREVLILVMSYFFFLMFVQIRAKDPPLLPLPPSLYTVVSKIVVTICDISPEN